MYWSFGECSVLKRLQKTIALCGYKKKYKEWCDLAKSKSRIRDVGGKRALFISELAKLWDIGAKDAVATIRENRLLTASDKEEYIAFYAHLQGMREAVMSGKDKVFKDKFAKKFKRQQPLLVQSSVITKQSVESKIRA